jgi:O-antigen/teichoic acid export membrane protein
VAGIRGAVLISVGTISGQLLTLLAMPLLSRLYNPADLGHLSVFISMVGMLSTIAALHFELAIPLPVLNKNATIVAALAMLIVGLMSLLLTLVLSIGDNWLLTKLGAPDLKSSRYWLPLCLLLTGWSTVLTLNTVRYQTYARNALSKGLQGGVQAISQAGAGLMGTSWTGLVVGQVAGMLAGIVPLVQRQHWSATPMSLRAKYLRLVATMRKYRNFPLLAAPSSLVNSAASNIPALLLAAFFGLQVAGLYGIGFRVLQLPARFVGQSVSQVFLGQAAQAMQRNELAPLVDSVFRFLMTVALHVFISLAILAPPLFAVAFGDSWIEAGSYARYLMPLVALSFVSTPLSMLVTVLQKQRQELWLQCAYLAIIVISLACGAAFASPRLALLLLGYGGGAFLCAKIWWLLSISGCRVRHLLSALGRELGIAVFANIPLLVLLYMNASQLWISVAGALWMTAVQWVNLRARGAYAF